MKTKSDFGIYVNKLFLNAFSKTPDSSIGMFLNEFAPILINPPKNVEGWVGYPSEKNIPRAEINHSIILEKHPFIKANIKKVEFKVYTDVYSDTQYKGFAGIRAIEIILDFQNFKDAESLFEKLKSELKSGSSQVTDFEDNSRKYIKGYCDELLYDIPCGVRICLMKEISFTNWYQLVITTN